MHYGDVKQILLISTIRFVPSEVRRVNWPYHCSDFSYYMTKLTKNTTKKKQKNRVYK